MRRVVLLALAACGNGSSGPRTAAPTSGVTPQFFEAQPAAPDDAVVARVNGKPVYASCVVTQGAAHGLDAKAALDECVAFELMAQEAEARGLRAELDVADAWRRELVRAVIEDEYAGLTEIEQFPREILAAIKYDEFREALHRPESRRVFWFRAAVKKTDPPEYDQKARELAEALYAELGDDEGVLPAELFDAGNRLAAERGLRPDRIPSDPKLIPPEGAKVQGVLPVFRDAAYAIPAIGRLHPPIRTNGGWDVLLWHDTLPAADLTPGFVRAAQQRYFAWWTDRLGVTYDIDDQKLAEVFGE